MFKYLLILIFSKTIILTPSPINITSDVIVNFNSKQELSAITTGASFGIGFRKDVNLDIPKTLEKYSDYKINIELIFSDNSKLKLKNNSMSFDNEYAYIDLSTESFPINKKFSKISLISNKSMENIIIVWRNFSE